MGLLRPGVPYGSTSNTPPGAAREAETGPCPLLAQDWQTVAAGGPWANTALLPALQTVPLELSQYIYLLCPVTLAELTGCDREYVALET